MRKVSVEKSDTTVTDNLKSNSSSFLVFELAHVPSNTFSFTTFSLTDKAQILQLGIAQGRYPELTALPG